MRLLFLAPFLLAAAPAAAQQVDQCAMTPAPGPLAPLIQKLTCRLQIEDNLRMAAEENLIIAQADQKIAEARADRIQVQLNDVSGYLKKYIAGIHKLKLCKPQNEK